MQCKFGKKGKKSKLYMFQSNKFVDVLWFKYLLLRVFVVISPSKTADWQSKARNNKYLNQRTFTNLLL